MGLIGDTFRQLGKDIGAAAEKKSLTEFNLSEKQRLEDLRKAYAEQVKGQYGALAGSAVEAGESPSPFISAQLQEKELADRRAARSMAYSKSMQDRRYAIEGQSALINAIGNSFGSEAAELAKGAILSGQDPNKYLNTLSRYKKSTAGQGSGSMTPSVLIEQTEKITDQIASLSGALVNAKSDEEKSQVLSAINANKSYVLDVIKPTAIALEKKLAGDERISNLVAHTDSLLGMDPNLVQNINDSVASIMKKKYNMSEKAFSQLKSQDKDGAKFFGNLDLPSFEKLQTTLLKTIVKSQASSEDVMGVMDMEDSELERLAQDTLNPLSNLALEVMRINAFNDLAGSGLEQFNEYKAGEKRVNKFISNPLHKRVKPGIDLVELRNNYTRTRSTLRDTFLKTNKE